MTDKTALEYMAWHVRRYRMFTHSGPQPGPQLLNCSRGLVAKDIERYPELEGKHCFVFDYHTETKAVTNGRFMTLAGWLAFGYSPYMELG